MTRTRTAYYKAGADTDRDPWGCRCKPKSYVLAHFRNQELISVTRMHNRLNGNGSPQNCGMAPEPLDPRDWDGRR